MNVVVISGRLTRKPELRSTGGGTNLCQFSLAVDNGKTDIDGSRGVDFIECVCFGKNAENLVKYQDKGSMLEVKGRIQVDRYTNKDGKNLSKTYVCGEMINYISKPQTSVYEAKNDEKDPYQQMGTKINSELPF